MLAPFKPAFSFLICGRYLSFSSSPRSSNGLPSSFLWCLFLLGQTQTLMALGGSVGPPLRQGLLPPSLVAGRVALLCDICFPFQGA